MLPTSSRSHESRGRLKRIHEQTASFNDYLTHYQSLTSALARSDLLNEMIPPYGRAFGPQILELIESSEPTAESRIALLRLGCLNASEDLSIHAYALEQFPSGKDRSSLIRAALTYYPTEEIGHFLVSMEHSPVERDIRETARLISEERLLGRPQISDAQLQQMVDSVESQEIRSALVVEAAERSRRKRLLPAADQE